MMRLDISLLGTLQITRDGVPVSEPAYGKVLALVAYLATEADRPHQRSSIAAMLWPDHDEERARHNLRQALTTLRRLVGQDGVAPCLQVSRDTIAFATTVAAGTAVGAAAGAAADAAADATSEAEYRVDVHTLTRLLEERSRHPHADAMRCAPCTRRLEAATALCRGDFLEGFSVPDSEAFEDWVQTWRERLREQVLRALDDLVESYTAHGDQDGAIRTVRRQLEIDPLREASHRRLMTILWQTGQRSAALAHYARCEALLDEELGVEPEEETVALYESIRDGAPRPNVIKGNGRHAPSIFRVPVSPIALVGREKETAAIVDLLARQDCRLLTLTGPGGSGKTRLAIHVASGSAQELAEVICFVPLASVRNADGVVAAIASELGIRLRGPEPPARQLQMWLRERSTLLVLDNAEQIVDDLQLIPSLLENVPDLTILVTSRERLNLTGEWVYNIGGLPYPHTVVDDGFEGYGAVDLFLDRLRQVRFGVPLHHDERPDVIRICQLVEGMPLALELAAAWATTLSLREISEGIRQNVDFLSASSRDQPDRHRSMRAVFDSSWELLTAEEQATWRRFSIFENGFMLDAAQQVAAATLQSVAALINKSLMTRMPSGRFRLHGVLKQFGDEKLREHPVEYAEVMERHTRFYLGLLADEIELLTGGDQPAAIQLIANDIDNIRLAWNRAVRHEMVTELVAAAPSYWLFLVIHGWMREGQSAFGAMLSAMERRRTASDDVPHDSCLALGMAQVYKGGFESGLGLYDGAIDLLSQGIACMRDRTTGRNIGLALNMLAAALTMKGQYAEARALLEESLEEFDRVRDDWGKAFSLNDLGMMLYQHSHEDDGERYCAQSREIFMRVGDNRGQAFAASNLGLIAMQRGDHQRAIRFHREALALSEARGDQWGVAMSLVKLGHALGLMHDDEQARKHLQHAIRIAWENSIAPVVLEALSEVAALDVRAGDLDRGTTILTAIARHPSVQGPVREHVLTLLQSLGEDDVPEPAGETDDRWAVRMVNDAAQSVLRDVALVRS